MGAQAFPMYPFSVIYTPIVEAFGMESSEKSMLNLYIIALYTKY